MSYEIKIDIGRLLHYSEPLKPQIDNETLLLIMKSFSSYIKRLYLSMIEEAIYSRRYKGEWEPKEDEEYVKFLGTEPSEAHIITLISNSLEVRKLKTHIVIRINPRVKYPNSDLPLIRVLKAIDNGTSKFNARPILKGIVRQINSNLPTLWKSYLKKKGVA